MSPRPSRRRVASRGSLFEALGGGGGGGGGGDGGDDDDAVGGRGGGGGPTCRGISRKGLHGA